MLIEHWRYDAPNPERPSCCGKRRKETAPPPGVAISVRNLHKGYHTSVFKRKSKYVTAIEELTLDVPKGGIFVLLGPNGSVLTPCCGLQ